LPGGPVQLAKFTLAGRAGRFQRTGGLAEAGALLRPTVTVRMENLPGAGAAAFRKLADAGVNVELLLPVHISDEEFLRGRPFQAENWQWWPADAGCLWSLEAVF
jgi:hypothetical protein